MYDIIIKGGTVYDGTGKPGYKADVAINKGKIAAIGDLKGKEAKTVVNAKGKAVTPGFIDMHSHGDMTLPFFPDMESVVRQGVTTISGGQCGNSLFPVDKLWVSQYFENMQMLEACGALVAAPDVIEIEKIAPILERDFGRAVDWRTFDEYVASIRKSGLGANYVPLVGHGSIRAQVMGRDYKRTATDAEINEMCKRLEKIMKSGARGMSTGLDYAPGIYADFKELKALCKVLAKYDGIYDPHWRRTGLREGTPKRQKRIDGIIETLELGLQTGVQVHFAHLTFGFEVFPADDAYVSVASAERTLQIIDEYRQKGVRVTYDVIPNTTAGILEATDLASHFAEWVLQAGSVEGFCEKLRYPDFRAPIKAKINSGQVYGKNPATDSDWADQIKILKHKDSRYVGRKIGELSKELGADPLDLILDLLAEDPYTKAFTPAKGMHEASIKTFIDDPNGTIGSDTFALDDTILFYVDRAKTIPPYHPNPNTYCAFPRYILEYPQETFEATIRKITGKPAEILGLADRGTLEKGKKADVLVLDLKNLRTNESHIDPRAYPSGIDYVFVNGTTAVCEGKPTFARAGEVILR